MRRQLSGVKGSREHEIGYPNRKPYTLRGGRAQAEAAFWRLSEGYRVGWSDELLGFDCGGQQWVLEAAFPTGTLRQGAPRCSLVPWVLPLPYYRCE